MLYINTSMRVLLKMNFQWWSNWWSLSIWRFLDIQKLWPRVDRTAELCKPKVWILKIHSFCYSISNSILMNFHHTNCFIYRYVEGRTAVWPCYQKWTDRSELFCMEGLRKPDKLFRYIMLMKITKHTSMFLQLEDMLSYNSTLQTTEAPADTVVVLDPDSMTWTPRKTSAVRLFLCILSIQILKLENMYQIFFLTQSSSFPAKRASAAMASSTTGVYLFGGLNTET